jgi:hypothetical protein
VGLLALLKAAHRLLREETLAQETLVVATAAQAVAVEDKRAALVVAAAGQEVLAVAVESGQ